MEILQVKKGGSSLQEELWSTLPWAHAHIVRGDMEELRKPKPVDIATLSQKTLLETFAPPSVIVNDRGDILYVHGQTGKYLEPAQGHASLNILDMAREGIRYELRSGIHFAVSKMKERRYQGLHVKTNGDMQSVNLIIRPLSPAGGDAPGMVMVNFEDIPHVELGQVKNKKKRPAGEQVKRIDEMEQELTYTRETLQATIEELQASNEELKSTNEELQSTNEEFQSTNEELETSREELQSVNEELVTLNSELQAKIDQLSQTETDMKILLDNTHIGIIFLDKHLCIKRFTTEVTKVFNLIPSDLGRPLHDIRYNLEYEDLEREAKQVLDTLQTKEMEIPSKDGKWYLVRIIPYRTGENIIDGVVLTFTDTTRLRGETIPKAAG